MNSAPELSLRVKNAKLLIFDFDGTLVDLEELNFAAMKQVVRGKAGVGLSRDEYREFVAGGKSSVGLEILMKRFGVRDYEVDELVAEFRKYKKEALSGSPDSYAKLIAGADSFVRRSVANGKVCAIASSSGHLFVKMLLEHFGIYNLFSHIVAAGDVQIGKPDPEPYELVLDHFKVERQLVVAFEDSKRGIRSAKGAGLYTVGIHRPGWNDEFVYELADEVIDGYEELM